MTKVLSLILISSFGKNPINLMKLLINMCKNHCYAEMNLGHLL